MTRKEKTALLFTALAGSQIPDIDIISSLWDTAGRYQMWHRGLTHSLFMIPLWAGLIALIARWIWQARGWRWYAMAALAVFIHDASDLFNAWGTGFFEPLSSVRITFGTVPIVDLVFWVIMLGGLLYARFTKRRKPAVHRVYRTVWLLLVLHTVIQTAQGAYVYVQAAERYEQVALSADFVPGVFTVVGKNGESIELGKATAWSSMVTTVRLASKEDADLEQLFRDNPKAATLYEWAPFVVIEESENRIGLYDPRFYRNGKSMLYEYMDK